GDHGEQFGMTPLACRTSDRRNGVSALHGAVARRMWKDLWPKKKAADVPIGSITNGIHLRTWLHPKMATLLDEYLPKNWEARQDQPRVWQAAKNIPDAALWELHQELKAELIEFVRDKLLRRLKRNGAPAARLAGVDQVLSPNALTIGFARRFAPYKRAALAFSDPARFARLLNNTRRPVQILFAGKAHPADAEGKALVHKVAKLADSPRFRNRVVFLEDYEMEIGRYLVAGVDVWLNNPRKPQEASGTSGMKPTLHGGLNLSILDGWWPEGFEKRNGWAIGKGKDHDGSRAHDKRDVAELYRILEREVVPLFFDRTARGLPKKWISRMKHSLATVPPRFNSHRQVKEYWAKYYRPALRKA
ncbi:MAG: alpha-glucan family phosphorylase, partial [bacterium]|nr:alpha-glucan family phosphorylase [bacterium]